MMKSFFKKLAFVMALAMVVTLAAPAAKKAVAAEEKEMKIGYQKGAAITALNLAEVGDTEDLRFLYAPENWKDLDVVWSSTNPNVVSVDDNGIVKAEAAGHAVVSVAVGDKTASIDVYSVDMKTFEATIGTKEERKITEKTIEIGDSFDFAFFGVLDYDMNRYNCQWLLVDPAGVAELDRATGEVTAKAAGTAVLTLVVINKVTLTEIKVADCIINIPAEEVPVEETDIVAEINKTQNTIEITFDEPVESLPAENVTMFKIFTAADDETGLGEITDPAARKGYKDFYVKTTWANEDKTVWTVQTFDDFEDAVWYEVRVAGYEPEEFEASVGPVATVEVITKNQAYLESAEGDLDLVPAYLGVILRDAKGVDVTTRVVDGLMNSDESNITYWLAEEDYEKFNLLNYNGLEFYEMATAKAMATYEVNGSEITNATPLLVSPKARNEYGIEKVIDWTIVKEGDTPNWAETVKNVPAGEYDYVIAVLFQDTRGDYYCTYQKGAEGWYDLANGLGWQYVNWTEDKEDPFWLNGCYVEFKAMHDDKMLVEIDGEIASYEEGRARFALYLYNQNRTDNEFVEEVISKYVNVCHPRQLNYFNTDTVTINLMKNTEQEYELDAIVADIMNAYYSEFSVKNLKITMMDIHNDKADLDDAMTAKFDIILTSEKDSNEVLRDKVERVFLERLEDAWTAAPQEFKVKFEAKDFIDPVTGLYITKKNQVKFTIVEETTNTKKNITINLIDLAEDKVNVDVRADGVYEDHKIDGTPAFDVDLIKVFEDKMPSPEYFDKFVVNKNKVSVNNYVWDANDDKSWTGSEYGIFLYQQDVKGHNVGFDSDIWVANAKITNNRVPYANVSNGTGDDDTNGYLSKGDRVLVITDKYGKVYPVVGDEYANPAYNSKEGVFAAPSTTTALGVTVKDYKTATSASGDSVGIDKYQFAFRTVDPDTNEVIYAKEGTYTAEIRTVRGFAWDNGVYYVVFTRATGLSDKVTFTVENTNPEVTYKNRDAIRYDDRSVFDYTDTDATLTRVMGNDEAVKELIIETFNFKLGNDDYVEAWVDGVLVDGNYALSAEDILYYTYTVTPSNNQLVINDVTFKVPVLNRYWWSWAQWEGVESETGAWYRSKAIVNKSISFGE